ncbi:heme-binding protein [Cryobacterium algoritolerans]|uniref:Heme-binding protein n=1 Tax=Cryobacterium algoritolerans TaxID=1259184 RepID=A0A4R8WUR8_9MICO|nr:heme-binding protein [Cryobacterium algoritolerans]TFC17408.1 heme-binding protein [Cryobacterium algoritolerans]
MPPHTNTTTPTYTAIPTIGYETAARAIALAIEEGAKVGVNVAATVVDPGLGLVAYGRADGTTPHSVETSRRKANTGASTRRPSSLVPAALAVPLEHGTGGLLTGVAGGVPIGFDGIHVGGLGVAGGPPPMDAQIAAAVLDALGADPVPAA